MRLPRALTIVLALVVAPWAVAAQEPVEAPGAQAPLVRPAPEPPPTPAADYVYAPAGRRDPFVSLVNLGTGDPRTEQVGRSRPEGVPGLMVEEIVVRGLVQSRDGWAALVGAPNGRTYTIRPGDRLLDGSVQTISAQVVVLHQDVRDPKVVDTSREVRKFLRGEGK